MKKSEGVGWGGVGLGLGLGLEEVEFYKAIYASNYFVSPFHRCRANAISTYYAGSGARQYTSRDGSNSVAPVRSYLNLRSHALTALELPC